ncbi:hypothetical protein AB6A40_011600, partial [Gnathostoma spinigerum]
MDDATRIPKPSFIFSGPTITFELKPKQGFFQEHPGIDIPYCNNCILQLEKCESKAFDTMYDFCPLDLYSGKLDRMRRAIKSLILVPHRNLRIFLDGTVIHSDEIPLDLPHIEEIIFNDGSATMDNLITALCCALAGCTSEDEFELQPTSVLSRLLSGQRIDTVGIIR